MKLSANVFNHHYISVDDKASNKNRLLKNNDENIVTNLQPAVGNFAEKNANSLDSVINHNIIKEREIREASLPEYHNSIKVDKLINLIIKIINNINKQIDIKNTNQYIELNTLIYKLRKKISNDKILASALEDQINVNNLLKKEIQAHEYDVAIYSRILILAQESTTINQIYNMGHQINSEPLSSIKDKIYEISNIILSFIDINENESEENINNKKELLIKKLDDFLISIDSSHLLVENQFLKTVENDINNKLNNLSSTPIRFELNKIYQEVVNSYLDKIDINDQRELLVNIHKINIVTRLFNEKYRFNQNSDKHGLPIEVISVYALWLIYSIHETDQHAFGDLTIEDIVKTEIIYSYTDDNDNIISDTFNIFEYLTRHIEEINSPLMNKKNINIKFPTEFSPVLINYLNEEAINLKNQIDMLKNIDLLKEEKDKLLEKMPHLENYLAKYLAQQSEKFNVNNTSLDDLVKYHYKSYSYNPEVETLQKHYFPPIEKMYTVRDILLGRERKWSSENLNYKLDEVLGALYPDQYTKELINKINSADIQNSYIAEMEKIKKNNEIKKQFYDYLEHVLTTYGKKNVIYYLMEGSPGLLIFPDKDHGPVTGLDININRVDPKNTPVAVISLFTGECLHYPSFRDFKRAVSASEKLKSWVKFHFNNYSELNPLDLKLKRENIDYSFIFESIIDFNIKKADILIKSHTEALLFELFSRLEHITVLYSFFSLLMGNLTGMIYGSLLAATPSFLKASISDQEEEYKNYLNQGIQNIVAELIGVAISEVMDKSLRKAVKLYSQYKFKRRVINYEQAEMVKLIQDFQKDHFDMKITLSPEKNENRVLLKIEEKFNPNNLTVAIPAEKYLAELHSNPAIAKKIDDPITEDDSSITAIAKYMRDHDMTDIRYRGVSIWNNAQDESPMNHLTVVGKKDNKEYVFDLTAHRFKNNDSSPLDGPLILEDSMWEKRYREAFPKKLIKYRDFAGEQMAVANFRLYFNQSAIDIIDGSKTLNSPDWYIKELTAKTDINPTINKNPLLNVVHAIELNNKTYKNNWEYISDVLYRSHKIDEQYKEPLIRGLSTIARNSNAKNIFDPSMRILRSYRQVRSMNELIQAKAGEILFFYTEEEKLVHMLVSLGNGLFSGRGNSKLGAYLNNSNSMIMAEQIGNFVSDKIERYAPELGKLKVYAAQPYGSALPQNTIKDIAQEALKKEPIESELPEFMTQILGDAQELTFEQTAVFQEDLRAILKADNNKTSVSSLLTNIKNIDNVTQLSALPAGRLVFFYNSDYSLKSMMISLGEGKFVISQGDHIGLATKQLHDIVSVDKFARVAGGRFNYTNIITGTINLQRMRQKTLLGQNSVFNLVGNTLFVKPQGRPSIINYMDSTDLSNIIAGLAIKIYGLKKWQEVETIELQSCFGGFGSIPSGQVIAHKLDKRVIVHAFSIENGFVKKNYESAPTPKVYEADVYLSDDDLKLAMQQNLANSEFWKQLILLFENSDKLIDRINDSKFGLKDVSGHLVFDMAKLILKKMDLEDFLSSHPEYYGFNGKEFNDIFRRLKKILDSTEVTNSDQFAEFMISLISFNKHSYTIIDKFLSSNLLAVESINKALEDDSLK
ncbi:hypothetical protein [Arsenophonus apicola]|uniref:Tox-PLDMTX domain-containing protein n=1 Tax=Arsenophonus apicola TaxID=2879119 RepID=A0ABY8P529_9GAMM|nr:hypothetical protein [Arsenophonus apicola]WGO83479.1 hypothetical protein QG404_14355 [Arsenophonus apicola]